MGFNLLKDPITKTLPKIDPIGYELAKNTDPIFTKAVDRQKKIDQGGGGGVAEGSSTATTPNNPNTPMEVKSRTPAGGFRDITAETVRVKATGVGGPTDFADPLAEQRNKYGS